MEDELVESMKNMFYGVCLVAAGVGAAALAQSSASNPESARVPASNATRIAVMNFQQAVAQTTEFQKALADLRKKYAPREQALEQLNQQIEALKKQVQDGGTSLPDAQRQSTLQQIDDKTKSLQRSAEELRNDEQSDGQQTFQQVASKVGPMVVSYARKHGFAVVLDAGEQTGGVLWWTPGVDITKAIVDAYNAQSGVPAPNSVPSAPAPNSPRQ